MNLQLTEHGVNAIVTLRATASAGKIRLARTLILTAVMLSPWSSGAAAQLPEFKCYVIAEDSTAHLRLLESKDLDHAKQAAARPLKLSKKRSLGIAQVMDCLPANASFIDPAARALDERTPR